MHLNIHMLSLFVTNLMQHRKKLLNSSLYRNVLFSLIVDLILYVIYCMICCCDELLSLYYSEFHTVSRLLKPNEGFAGLSMCCKKNKDLPPIKI